MDETTARVFEQLEDMRRRYDELRAEVAARYDDLQRQIAEQASEINSLGLRLKQIDRPRMTATEALQTFDVLKRTDPSLTLQSFAMQHNLSYDTLRQARSRQQRKKK